MRNLIISVLDEMFPNPKCELEFKNNYELLVAVILSAQSTDKSVNKVTPLFFEKFPSFNELANATRMDVVRIIKSIGLANSKACNLIELANQILTEHQGEIPQTKEQLIKLPGVGTKTANVYLAVGLGVNAFAVDTHVLRVANRLGISNTSNTLIVERDLMNFFDGCDWKKLHHQFIHFGRYHCKASGMLCDECKLKKICKKVK